MHVTHSNLCKMVQWYTETINGLFLSFIRRTFKLKNIIQIDILFVKTLVMMNKYK